MEQLAHALKNGLEIKERRYRLKTYQRTFLGCDAVEFIQNYRSVSEKKAIQLGNQLISEAFIHHVCDDHLLENSKLFYRFYNDEKSKSTAPMERHAPATTLQQQIVVLRLCLHQVQQELIETQVAQNNTHRKDTRRFELQVHKQEQSIQHLLRMVLLLAAMVVILATLQTTRFSGSGSLVLALCMGYSVYVVHGTARNIATRHGVPSLVHLMRGNKTEEVGTGSDQTKPTPATTPATPSTTPATTLATTAATSSVDTTIELIPSSLDISKLLVEHAMEIKKLQLLVPPPTVADRWLNYDNIFYLRYILSFGTAEQAKDAIEYTYTFRATPKFQHLAHVMANDQYFQLPGVVEAKRWQVGAPLQQNVLTKESGGGIAVMIRMGMCNMSMMHDRISKNDIYDMNLGQREGAYQLCDRLTRETGMLCKQSMFMDMKGCALSSMMDRRQGETHAAMSKISSRIYPQLMDKFCILNAPSWMNFLMSVYKKIGSKRSLAKFELFTSTNQLWESKWAQQRLVRANFPAFVGGNVPDEALSDDMKGSALQVEPLPQLTIGARAVEKVYIDVGQEETGKIEYCFHLLSRSIEVRVMFVPSNDMDGAIVVSERKKVNAEDGPQRGTWDLKKKGVKMVGGGVLQVEFDNSSSSMRSKTVVYSFDVVERDT